MPAVLDPPANDTAQSVFGKDSVPSFETANPRPEDFAGKPAQTSKPEPSTQVLEDKPAAMKEATPEKPKSRMDKIGEVKKPEAKVEPPKVEDKTPAKPEEAPKDIPSLRKAYELSKAEAQALKSELEKVKPDYEKIKAELGLTKEEMGKLKALNLNEDERKEFGRYRELHALEALRTSKDFQEKIMGPINARLDIIREAGESAKLSPAAFEALKVAIDTPGELARGREIRRIFKDAVKSDENPEGIEPDELADFTNAVTAAARELNAEHYPRLEAKEREAVDIQQSARTRDKEQGEQATQKEKEAYQKEHESVLKALSEGSLKLLVDDTDLSVEGTTLMDALKNATPADNPTDKAFEVQAAAAMPFMVAFLNKTLERAFQAEEGARIMNGSKPKLGDALPKTNESKEQPMDANTVFKSVRTFGG